MPIPIKPEDITQSDLLFDVFGDRLVLIWWTEDGDGDYNVIALFDIPEKKEIRRTKLPWLSSVKRVFLDETRVVLLYNLEEYDCQVLDSETLEPLGEISRSLYAPEENEDEGTDSWPNVPMNDGLRALIEVTVDRKEAKWWNRESTFHNFVMNRRPEEGRSGLSARIPAAGLDMDLHAVSADSRGRWLLVYYRPYTDQKHDSFFVCDTEVFGKMPAYVVARAVSTNEQLSLQRKRRCLLDESSALLDAGGAECDTRCFALLKEAYDLYPDNPDEEWQNLNNRASQVGTRVALLGTHRGEIFKGNAFDEKREPLERYYRDPGNARREKFFRLKKRGEVWAGEYGTAKSCETRFAWPQSLVPWNVFSQEYRDTKVEYDAEKNKAYLCRNCTISAWDCSVQPPQWLGAVRFGKSPEKDYHPWRLEPFLPSEDHKLWTVQPAFFQLVPPENARVALIYCSVLNVYGADRISEAYTGVDGFEAVMAIDLRSMKLVKQAFYSSNGKILDLGSDGLFAHFELRGVSLDGSVLVWNGMTGSEVWAFSDRGAVVTALVSGYEIDGVRGDGNALLHRMVFSKSGDTNQEIFLDWQLEPKASGSPSFKSEQILGSELTEEEFYRDLGLEKPGAE